MACERPPWLWKELRPELGNARGVFKSLRGWIRFGCSEEAVIGKRKVERILAWELATVILLKTLGGRRAEEKVGLGKGWPWGFKTG